MNCLEPHPTAPVLATSGLDHDIKMWIPTASEPTRLEDLKKVCLTNKQIKKKGNDDDNDNNDDGVVIKLIITLMIMIMVMVMTLIDGDNCSESH